MAKTRTIGTILVAALIGLVSVFLASPKKMKKRDEVKKERTNLFI
jgi:hypothetical protein